MKIVIAVHHFLPRYRAGAELRAYETAKWLRKNGNETLVVCVEHIDQGPQDGLSWSDDAYDEIPVRRLSFDLSHAPNRFRWEYDNPWIKRHLQDFLKKEKPDIFHLFSGYLLGAGAIRAAKVRDIPIVITLTDYWFLCQRINFLQSNGNISESNIFDSKVCTRCKFEEKRRFRLLAKELPDLVDHFWEKAFETWLGTRFGIPEMKDQLEQRNLTLMKTLSEADILICPSRFIQETFQARGVDKKKLLLNTHGIDQIVTQPRNMKSNKNDSVQRIGYLGQIEFHKGVHLLIEAFKFLKSEKPIELVIYGSSSCSPNYRRKIRNIIGNDQRIKIKGRYDHQHLGKIISELDVLVIPSIWNEIGPLVMYEALQGKIPVVASNIPNMSDVIQHNKNGLVFSCGSSLDLRNQLQRLISESGLLHKLSDGIGPVKSVDEEMHVLYKIYESLI